jgi:hypothetical protein
MHALRRLGQAPRYVRGRRAGAPDATIEPDPGPPPEAVFDRVTGPYARRFPLAMPGASGLDEET